MREIRDYKRTQRKKRHIPICLVAHFDLPIIIFRDTSVSQRKYAYYTN